jgi:hypothetical protein
VHGYNHSRPHQSLAMATPATLFRPAPIEPVEAMPALVDPLMSSVLDPVAPPRPAPALAVHSDSLADNDIHAVEFETDLTARARLVLPGNQQMKFTAALARRTVTIWANDRSIHVMLDGTVIRTRASRLSEHDLRELVRRGARHAGAEPARSAVSVAMLTTSTAIDVPRTVDRDGYVGLGGTKVLLLCGLARIFP